MQKIFENTTKIANAKDYESAMAYIKKLIAEATSNGALATPDADNEYVREIARIGRLCANYEDAAMQFKQITVRGRSPLVRALQEEMYKRDIRQKDIANLIGVNDAVFSLFMTGKRHLSMTSARKLHQKLHIDPKLILEYA
ncbi:hypothetical protein FACS18945_3020 [Bacteroidia bacterium]|nr:hypothetical protein FACS18945_3020 [Bacteroidia bacterium]